MRVYPMGESLDKATPLELDMLILQKKNLTGRFGKYWYFFRRNPESF